MDPLFNKTEAGNEKSFKKGTRVPSDAAGLAYVKTPALTPANNIVIIDTSQTVNENRGSEIRNKKLMYANATGILEDEYGNQIINDEFPAVTDVFTVEEDYSKALGNEYTIESILPYRHVSRYFHIDNAGITVGNDLQVVVDSKIAVIDSTGREYLDDNGNKRYKIYLIAAIQSHGENNTLSAYRVHAFVDDDTNEDLFLTYNKGELNSSGFIVNSDSGYKELLNPIPYFDYENEEANVVNDFAAKEKFYSTRPANKKKQLLGMTVPDIDGYKVYVPRKAIPDSRIFQLFRWRVKCDFLDEYVVDNNTSPQIIRCGVLTTASQPNSSIPYVFYNLQNSSLNSRGITFVNPLKEFDQNYAVASGVQKERAYWQVSLEDVTAEELNKFDILVMAMPTTSIDMAPYMAKVNYFTKTLGRTLFIDTGSITRYLNLGIKISDTVDPPTGKGYPVVAKKKGSVDVATMVFAADSAKTDYAFDGGSVGGWPITNQNDNSFFSISQYHSGISTNGTKIHRFDSPAANSDYTSLIEAASEIAATKKPILVKRSTPGSDGQIYVSVASILNSVNTIYNNTTGLVLSSNTADTMPDFGENYTKYINSLLVEGAYKLLFNVCLSSVRNRPVVQADPIQYSSSWSQSTPWKASWVIDGYHDVLSDAEKQANDFYLMPISDADSTLVWKRRLSNKTAKELIDEALSEADQAKVAGAKTTYTIETTSAQVYHESTIAEGSLIFAWTDTLSPEFNVPSDFGPHIIKEDNIIGDYADVKFSQKDFPAKPFAATIRASYAPSGQTSSTGTVNYTATYVATRRNSDTTTTPSQQSNGQVYWTDYGSDTYAASTRDHNYGLLTPIGIDTFSDANYNGSQWGAPTQHWPYWGKQSKLTVGSTGDDVKFVQDALNKLMALGSFDTGIGAIQVNGIYNDATKTAVLAFQNEFNANIKDGNVDVETWYLLGIQIVRFGSSTYFIDSGGTSSRFGYTSPGALGAYSQPRFHLLAQSISDNNEFTNYWKRSPAEGGPATIWETFAIEYSSVFTMSGVTITPSFPDKCKEGMLIKSIDVKRAPFSLVDYDPSTARVTNINQRTKVNRPLDIPFGPFDGNVLVVTVGQDKPQPASAKLGDSRVFGIESITPHVNPNQLVGLPVGAPSDVELTVSGTLTLDPDHPTSITLVAPATAGELTNIRWTGIVVDNPDVDATINISGLATLQYTNGSTGNYSQGPVVPNRDSGVASENGCYTMTENDVLVPGMNMGYISKADGLRLLCTKDKKPIGFPNLPSNVGSQTSQRQYTMLTVARVGTDPSIKLGFYDIKKKEFLFTSTGDSTMPFVEYMMRGPQNIYIAVVSDYEEISTQSFPDTSDAPILPFKWAMPVYGVAFSDKSQIGIDPLPTSLPATDMWPLPIRTGSFSRIHTIPERSSIPYSGYLNGYQGRSLKAFYSIPEARDANWSQLYGRPNIDIVGEHPEIIDEKVIRVARTPILTTTIPTRYLTKADPVRPIFRVFTRDGLDAAWEEIPRSQILDYNVSEGTITLRTALKSMDENLVKVDYTSATKSFNYVGSVDNKLFLNPHIPYSADMINKPIHLCMYPELVVNDNGHTIEDSIRTSTLFWTTDVSRFMDPIDPEYDPLIVELAIIYVTTALDIEDLSLIDTRKRGGGLKEKVLQSQISNLQTEIENYWDINPAYGDPYQKGGYIIVRLPESLKERFPNKDDILDIIRRNVPTGVEFKIENLHGDEWGL